MKETQIESKGLAYRIDDGGIEITGIGDCQDGEIVIPSAIDGLPVKKIGSSAFCESQANMVYSVIIPDTVETIGDYAFYNKNINNLSYGPSVKKFGEKWIIGYESPIKTIDYTGDLKSWCTTDHDEFAIGKHNGYAGDCSLRTIKVSVFGEHQPASLKLPDGLTRIGNFALFGLPISLVTIPESVQEIGSYAFSQCNNLTTCKLPDELKIIGTGAFANCTRLKNFTLPAHLESIGAMAFDSVPILSAHLPKTLISLGTAAFIHSGLKELHIYENINSLDHVYAEQIIYHGGRLSWWKVKKQEVGGKVIFQK